MLHLRSKDKNIICEIAKQCFSEGVEIWAYGSRVDGTSHDSSDLDLVVRSKDLKAIEIKELDAFIEHLRESSVPILIQVFDWARVPESFHKNILKNYEVLVSFSTK